MEINEEIRSEIPITPVIEAVLFATGFPVPYDRLAEITGASRDDIIVAVAALQAEYAAAGRGIMIVKLGDACQMCSSEDCETYVRDALGIKQGGRLSNSSLEVLAIIAYRQPVTRVQIEHIRGVDSSYAITALTAKGLIESKGRLDVPGKPNLYGTTLDFLRCFGLSSLDELPDASSFLIDEQIDIEEQIENEAKSGSDMNEKAESDTEPVGVAGTV